MTTFDPHPIYTELVDETRARGADLALPDGADTAREQPDERATG